MMRGIWVLTMCLTTVLVLAGCSSEGICTSTAFGTAGTSTDLDFGQCWDGVDRSVHCVGTGAGTAVSCTCSVGGNVGATFARTEPLVMSTPATEADLVPINAGCGWSLRPR